MSPLATGSGSGITPPLPDEPLLKGPSPRGGIASSPHGDESTLLTNQTLRTVAPTWLKIVRVLPWLLVALPALYQLWLIAQAIGGRVGYPFDLEWMEGGMLHHALRIQTGEGIYGPPSVDFIPYLYTPLYPAMLALFGHIVPLGYTLGRMISVLSLGGIVIVSYLQLSAKRHLHAAQWPMYAGAALGLGLFAATYPYVEGWYDLVRSDTLFLFMITGALSGLTRWCKSGEAIGGQARVAAAGALLALAFFCKQTGIIYVGFGGLIVLVLSWRRVPAYVLGAGAVGLGGVAVLNSATHGWFWIYVSKIHRAHDFNWDRVKDTPRLVLWHFPALTIVVGAALLIVIGAMIKRRMWIPQARPFLLWTAAYLVSTGVAATGWGTEFAFFNAFMPAFLHGALAAGAAVPALYGCSRQPSVSKGPGRGEVPATVFALIAAGALAWTCVHARWKPEQFIPKQADEDAGVHLVDRIKAIDGDVWMPSHPWYLHLAGKTPHVHRMGIKDVTWRQTRTVERLQGALDHHAFAALILDDRDVNSDRNLDGSLSIPWVTQNYRAALQLPATEKPRLYTGARVVPTAIWLPILSPKAPPGAHVVFDFEAPVWDGWKRSGPAWGNGPVSQPLDGEGLVYGATGQRWATSMNGGEIALGRMTSPPFVIDDKQLVMHLGGDTDATKVRVEVWIDGSIVATAGVPRPGGTTLRETSIDVAAWLGKEATIVLVDDQPSGHLLVDDVWLRR